MTMDLMLDFLLRLFVAGAMGAIIGLEREYRAKEAGYRTHFLVAEGSALMMLVSQYGFMAVLDGAENLHLDPSRIAAQVISGIGFIGAGTIILQKQMVRGLTTAAGIWVTAGIGLAIGAGMYMLGISATLLTLVGLEALSFFFKSLGLRSFSVEFVTQNKEVPSLVMKRLSSDGFRLTSYEMDEQQHGGTTTYSVSLVVKTSRNNEEDSLITLLHDYPELTVVRIN